jgi:copper transport protein
MHTYTRCYLSVRVNYFTKQQYRNLLLTVVALAIASFLICGTMEKSYGHAFLTISNPVASQSLPSPPGKVEAFFSEPVDIKYSQVKVLDPDGKEVDNKDIHYIGGDQASLSVTLPPLEDGVYTVSTNVLSQTDGHVTKSAFVFAVGQATIPSNLSNTNSESSIIYVPEAIARFPTLIGQVIIVGGAFSVLWIWRPLSKIQWLSDLLLETRKNIDKRLVSLFLLGSIILVVSDFAIVVFQASAISATVLDVLTTRFGMVLTARIFLSLTLLGVSLFEFRRFRKSKTVLSKGEITGIISLGITLLLTTSLIGHGAANNQFSSIAIDFVHNLAASIWIGGVIYIAFVLLSKLKSELSLDEYTKIAFLSILIPRFSTSVIVILGFIVITGPFLLYILENRFDLLISSLYGKTIIVKLTLASIMLALGAYNQLIIYRDSMRYVSMPMAVAEGHKESKTSPDFDPPLSKRQNKPAGKRRDLVSRFSRTTKIESVVGIILLASVAFLVNTGLPQSEFQNQFQQQEQPSTLASSLTEVESFKATGFIDNNTRVVLSITPFTVGSNNFSISFVDSKSNPIDMKLAEMKYTEIEKSIGPIDVDLQQVSKGVFFVKAAFGIPGVWHLQIEGVPNKSNVPRAVATFDIIIVKPKLDQLQFNAKRFEIPGNRSQPLYPIYDSNRNAIWVGDTAIDSGRILEFRLDSNKYVEHKINGTSIITVAAQDSTGRVWYVDPLTKHIGNYDPSTSSNKLYVLPNRVIPSAIAIDINNKVWITSPATNEILRFDPSKGNFTSKLHLQGKNASPIAIAIDSVSGIIWVTDEKGKLAMIDPSKNYTLTEFVPRGNNETLRSPTALLVDQVSGSIYISQHEGNRVSMFNPLTHAFNDYRPLAPNGRPFGMTLDKYHNLWVAEHTINKLAVIDQQTGKVREVTLPGQSPFVQWLTSDSEGNVWFAEQKGNALGVMKSAALSGIPQVGNVTSGKGTGEKTSFEGLPYSQIVAPSVAIGLILIAFMYVKSVIDFKTSFVNLNKRREEN